MEIGCGQPGEFGYARLRLPKTWYMMNSSPNTIPDWLSPRITRTALSAYYQDGHIKCASGGNLRARSNTTSAIWNVVRIEEMETLREEGGNKGINA